MKGLIYKIACEKTGKCYIGQTIQILEKRISRHLYESKIKKYPLYNAIRKYGWDSFIVEVLEDDIPLENLNKKELYYTEKFNALAPNGYVLIAGGEPRIVSEETRRKMSESRKGENNYNYGKYFSEEHKRKIGLKHRKKILCYDLDGNFLKKFNYIKEAAIELNISRPHISNVCKGKRKRVGNYKFKYND